MSAMTSGSRPPPPGAPGFFALSDEARLREFASEGGLNPQDVFDVDCLWVYPDEATALRGLSSSGVAAKAVGAVGQKAVDGAHAAAIEPHKSLYGSYRIGATSRVLIARQGTDRPVLSGPNRLRLMPSR